MVHSNIYNVYTDLIGIINSAEWYDFDVKICETECRSTSLSINLESLSNYTVKSICNQVSYKYSMQLYYQIATQTNQEKLNAIDILSKLGSWLSLEEIEYNLIAYKLVGYPQNISKIKKNSEPKLIRKNNNGLDVFMIEMEVTS